MRLIENPLSRLKRVMNGIEKGVISFGIVTSENPMGEKISAYENKQRQAELKEWLNNGIYQYIFVKGKYGNLENPFVILNINKDELLFLGTKFTQESVIFARNYFDYVEFQYWEQTDRKGNFTLRDTADHYVNLDRDDFYTYKKTWKFNIPFSIFEQIQEHFENNFSDFKKEIRDQIYNVNQEIVLSENKTMSHFYKQRGEINYYKKLQKMNLVNKNQSSFQETGSSFSAYWIQYGDVYEVDKKHIRFILDNPELFDMEKSDLITIYKKYGEKIGQEGKAREEIIKMVAKDGWIRVRHYQTPKDYWTIQVDNYRKRKRSIKSFIDYAFSKLGMDIQDAISIVGYEDGVSISYDFQQGGVGEYLIDE